MRPGGSGGGNGGSSRGEAASSSPSPPPPSSLELTIVEEREKGKAGVLVFPEMTTTNGKSVLKMEERLVCCRRAQVVKQEGTERGECALLMVVVVVCCRRAQLVKQEGSERGECFCQRQNFLSLTMFQPPMMSSSSLSSA